MRILEQEALVRAIDRLCDDDNVLVVLTVVAQRLLLQTDGVPARLRDALQKVYDLIAEAAVERKAQREKPPS